MSVRTKTLRIDHVLIFIYVLNYNTTENTIFQDLDKIYFKQEASTLTLLLAFETPKIEKLSMAWIED